MDRTNYNGEQAWERRIIVAINHDVFQSICYTFMIKFSWKDCKLYSSSNLKVHDFTSIHIFVWFRWSVTHSNWGMVCYICQGKNNMAWPIFVNMQERHIIYNIIIISKKRSQMLLEFANQSPYIVILDVIGSLPMRKEDSCLASSKDIRIHWSISIFQCQLMILLLILNLLCNQRTGHILLCKCIRKILFN